MSGTYPTQPSFTAVDFKITSPGRSTESFSGKIRRVSVGTQYYSFGVKYPNMTDRELGPIAAFIARQYGSYDSFQIVLPEISYPKGNNYAFIGAPQVALISGSLAAGTLSIPTNGYSGASKNEVLRAGDFIKFANHDKVYMVAENVNTNSSLEATITITPGLVTTVPNGTLLTTTAVPFTVCLEEFEQDYNVTFGGISTMGLKMREVT
jgi:hypothetical protein